MSYNNTQTILFKNKYRIPSTRLKNWDYSCLGMYSVTICIKNRELYFGDVKNGVMELSDMGKIARGCWLGIPEHFAGVELDEFVIMPNYVHGVVGINKNNDRRGRDEAVPRLYIGNRGEGGNGGKNVQMSAMSPKPGSLSLIVGSYKSICTKEIRRSCNPDFYWQPRFYDQIIRSQWTLSRIREYIQKNPVNWQYDQENKDRIENEKYSKFEKGVFGAGNAET